MQLTICHCCGGRMSAASATNPNICLDCEQMTFDNSPILAAETAQRDLGGVIPKQFSPEEAGFKRPRPFSEGSAVAGTLA